ncbi:MAG: response regulator [Candidatus Hydrogenedentes bacterium]|nr:response regulator [Candidatus Hydrogenedentota bacterium]
MSRILIADDRQDSIERLAREIAAEGYDVTIADTGGEVLEDVLRQPPPDIVILGPGLAMHDGYETCTLLRADPDIPARMPIILLADRDVDHRRMERAGFTAVLSRECAATDLRELLSQWIG